MSMHNINILIKKYFDQIIIKGIYTHNSHRCSCIQVETHWINARLHHFDNLHTASTETPLEQSLTYFPPIKYSRDIFAGCFYIFQVCIP